MYIEADEYNVPERYRDYKEKLKQAAMLLITGTSSILKTMLLTILVTTSVLFTGKFFMNLYPLPELRINVTNVSI